MSSLEEEYSSQAEEDMDEDLSHIEVKRQERTDEKLRNAKAAEEENIEEAAK